ncbi:MAG: SusC/RagA family TonB-linked outer membrane protein [Bacteroidetes bacterium]|nr:SusC/RagA family TonB-linked outer membrane protein [Bacteroidota bacterium]
MKLTIAFLIAGLFAAQARSFSQKITYTASNVPLVTVFSVIEKQTGYSVFANKELLSGTKPVSPDVKDMPLTDFLDLIFHNQPVDYEVNNKTIFIKEKRIAASPQPAKQPDPTIVQLPISGTVRNADAVPLEGATVSVKGGAARTLTKENGRFQLEAEPNQTLVISFVGYQTQEVAIGGRNEIDVVLKKNDKEMEAVVVTALGIQRKVKALTYNVQEIKSEDITTVNSGSLTTSLAGKVAGATINASAAGAGASARVVLRGSKSISNSNNVLYVIDGIPMTNVMQNQPEDIFSGAGQTGDFISNINPDDIESISVLSGPSAATLYGSVGASGVILITTKRGQKNKTDVSIASSTFFSKPLMLPEFQHTYGQTDVGSYYSWGDKLVTPSTYRPADFFQTGINSSNSVTLSTGSEKSQTYLSLGNVTSKGIIPNNNYNRSTLTIRNTSVLADGKLNLDLALMASLVNEQNMISQGLYSNPLVAVYLFPPGDDWNRVKAFERYDPSRNLMKQWWDYGDNGLTMQNPYWITQRDLFQNKKVRYIPSVSLKYNVAPWINITGRAKMDNDNDKYEKKFAATTNKLLASDFGYYSLNTVDTRQIYADVLANINKSLTETIGLTASVGSSIEDIVNNQYQYGGKLKGVANLYTYSNIDRSITDISQKGYHRQKQSVFGSAQFAWRNMLFVDATARNDWASTLAGSNYGSFFYSSLGVSGVVTDLLDIKSNALSYLKLRGSYSSVGNEPAPNKTIATYAVVDGNPVTQTRLPNPNLKPELTKSWEAGFNAMLFRGALKIDATVYSSRTYNQFFEPTLSATSGYTSVLVNAGRVDNKGIEISARYNSHFGQLDWSTYATYTLNKNKIVELLPNWTNPITGENISLHEIDMSGTGSYKMTLKEGGSMGDIYVNTLRVDEHGAIYVDPGSQTVVSEPNKFVYAGNSNPLYTLSWGNTLKWKGISLNFLLSGRVGGIVVSNTQAMLDAFGVSKASADARNKGGALANGRPVPAKEYYQVVGSGAGGGIASMYCYSATNVRLGELSLGYDLPIKKWVPFVKSANVSLVGHNLWMIYCTAPFDPELTANTGTYFQGIDYFMAPSLRSLGFSVKLNF